MWTDQGSWSTQDWAPERRADRDSSAALQRVHLELPAEPLSLHMWGNYSQLGKGPPEGMEEKEPEIFPVPQTQSEKLYNLQGIELGTHKGFA